MPSGVQYCSFLDHSGYGLAGIAYVRGLVNAGVPVHWKALVRRGDRFVPWIAGQPVPLLAQLPGDEALADLPALLEATSRPLPCDTIVAHTIPEHWPRLFRPGFRNVGYTVWETDALPPHWSPLLGQADRLCVPARSSVDAFVAAGLGARTHRVPHLHRHAWNAFAPSELTSFRAELGIPPGHFIFYTIGDWQPRKALPRLLQAYAQAFAADDPVTLIVKTTERGYGPPPFYPDAPSEELACAALEAIVAGLGRPAPAVCLLPWALNGRGIDLLHALGDCYVSLPHGEGWGLGAFDAATRGTPVVMTGWGGHLDFLGDDWPGKVPFKLATVPVWPPHEPSLWPPQRWAVPDLDAASALLRCAVERSDDWQAAALRIEEDIADRFNEPRVTRQYIEALFG